jgi:hypothetical protein
MSQEQMRTQTREQLHTQEQLLEQTRTQLRQQRKR